MMLEVLRELTDALQSTGSVPLSAELSALPLDAGDTVPDTPVIVDATRSFAAAIGRAPSVPALTVAFDETIDLDPERVQITRDGTCAVLFRYVVKDGAPDTAIADASYVMRALERCLDDLPFPLSRNGVSVYACTERRYIRPLQPLEDQWTVAGLRAVFQFRDTR